MHFCTGKVEVALESFCCADHAFASGVCRGRQHSTCQTPSWAGTKCEMRCPEGTRLFGPEHFECMNNGEWSHESECFEPPVKAGCSVEGGPAIASGRLMCAHGSEHGARCIVVCDSGFGSQRDVWARCEDGAWSWKSNIGSLSEPGSACERKRQLLTV